MTRGDHRLMVGPRHPQEEPTLHRHTSSASLLGRPRLARRQGALRPGTMVHRRDPSITLGLHSLGRHRLGRHRSIGAIRTAGLRGRHQVSLDLLQTGDPMRQGICRLLVIMLSMQV